MLDHSAAGLVRWWDNASGMLFHPLDEERIVIRV